MTRRRLATALLLAGLAGCAAPAPEPPRQVPVPSPEPAPPIPEPVRPPDPPPPPPAPSAVHLVFTGDINLGTLTLPDGVPPDSGRALLSQAAPALRGDLVVGNFEGVLGDSGTTYKCGREGVRVGGAARPDTAPTPRRRRAARVERPDTARRTCYAFLTPPHLAPRLREAGFTHLNLANNHANDFGETARAATEAVFDSLGLRHYGPLGRIAIDTVRRADSLATVALVGFTTYPYAYDLLDVGRSAAVVDSVRGLADLVIVTFHGGAEGSTALHVPDTAEYLGREPRGELRRWARAVIDAGADAVVGHGPHVLRGIEFHRGKPIVYSLGNFLTYRGFNLRGPLGITGVLQLELGADGAFRSGRLVPMVQPPRVGPVPDPAGAAVELVRRLSREDFGEAAARLDDSGAIAPPPATP